MGPLGSAAEEVGTFQLYGKRSGLAAVSFEYGNDLFLDMEIVLPTGRGLQDGKLEHRRRGGCLFPGAPGYMTYRF